MTRKIRWGVLGCAGIAAKAVIPAIQSSRLGRVTAIASRDPGKATDMAARFGIASAYGSYEALLADPDVDAIYNLLPNHLHVPLTVMAFEHGKPVLCEKPISLDAAQAMEFSAAQKAAGLPVCEAFMVRHHPQWKKARALVAEGRLGEVRTIQTIFSYYLDDPANVRNQAGIGGGGMLDVGCYAVSTARYLFGAEPLRAIVLMERADLRHGPPDEWTAGISRGKAAHFYLFHAACAHAEGDRAWNRWAPGNPDPLQPAGRQTDVACAL
ncbi:Gfo/Idh/MocA family oxidoreductase [Rhizobium hidalgonense]|uniref:Gfo/Idh/MocA family oxidoreductase n=1 Tax=Rhizobium hidalgonense TaxID=1538159 RepID=A0AAJ2GXN2_9HYPH|nr:Gfo/Idh/MocA family oxidoreductase [Rhizobium hidalgonense]MDR9776886.1 Gfo/Idh/MocA family oxidoreductase [Rhizobium hidalgonense]MDR9813929.1 Gfo/Idh/MocA family oxidoreductase [Rhizobium hidalgonense]MDR9820753.1 Gfo/Idh/MocA family oxidoreductase [Rhizobium hidalgonense]